MSHTGRGSENPRRLFRGQTTTGTRNLGSAEALRGLLGRLVDLEQPVEPRDHEHLVDLCIDVREAELAALASQVDFLPLLEKLEDFFGGPDLTTAISDFAAAHGAEFHPLPEGAEHPLQWHSRYLEYCGMIERQLEGFLQQHGCTSERLYAACREGDASHTCIEYLLASTEYLAFLPLYHSDLPCVVAECEGHRENDVLPFANLSVPRGSDGDVGSYTNRRLYALLHPHAPGLPYVYDSFAWPHCAEHHNLNFLAPKPPYSDGN